MSPNSAAILSKFVLLLLAISRDLRLACCWVGLGGERVEDGERHELQAAAFVELRLELYPVQSEGVEEALHDVHAHHDACGHAREDCECDPELEKAEERY